MFDLKERLNAMRTTKFAKVVRPETASPLPYLQPLENAFGVTFFTDKIYIENHGEIDPKNFPQISADTLRFLSLDRGIVDFCSRDAVFLDIETTGTAGGAGTFAFLVGLGFCEEGYFQVRQFFLHDLAQEAAFLHAISEFCSRFRYLVTYNGKCFDAQILRTRYSMHRREDPLSDKQHIDMLFIARRLWKRLHRDCDLMNLERQVLNFHRLNDIPSWLIPSAYTDYLRFARGSLIQQVLHHNQWDILSLAVLTARACRIPTDGALSPEEHFSVSLLYERHKDYQSAIRHQLQALEAGAPMRGSLLLHLARNLRRVRDRQQMSWLVTQADGMAPDGELCRQLSIVCEHELKDYALALKFVQSQLQKIEKFRGLSRRNSDDCSEWQHRKARLLRKKNRHSEPLL